MQQLAKRGGKTCKVGQKATYPDELRTVGARGQKQASSIKEFFSRRHR
jgi:hypothetical protein